MKKQKFWTFEKYVIIYFIAAILLSSYLDHQILEKLNF